MPDAEPSRAAVSEARARVRSAMPGPIAGAGAPITPAGLVWPVPSPQGLVPPRLSSKGSQGANCAGVLQNDGPLKGEREERVSQPPFPPPSPAPPPTAHRQPRTRAPGGAWLGPEPALRPSGLRTAPNAEQLFCHRFPLLGDKRAATCAPSTPNGHCGVPKIDPRCPHGQGSVSPVRARARRGPPALPGEQTAWHFSWSPRPPTATRPAILGRNRTMQTLVSGAAGERTCPQKSGYFFQS